jgi:hypothetical protein
MKNKALLSATRACTQSLDLAGTTISMLQVFDSALFSNDTCGGRDNSQYRYQNDLPKMIFWYVMGARLFVMPLIHHVSKKVGPRRHPQTGNILLFEKMLVESLKSMSFVILNGEAFEVSKAVTIPVSLLTLWPMVLYAYKQQHHDFSQGCYSEYKDYFETARQAKIFGLFEAVHNSISFAASVGMVVSFLFNVFYDASHTNDYPDQQMIIAIFILAGFVMGGLNVLNKKTYHLAHKTQASIDIFYFCFMNMASALACIAPEKMQPDGFLESGWKYCTGFAVASLFVSAGTGLCSDHEPFEWGHAEDDAAISSDNFRYQLFHNADDAEVAGDMESFAINELNGVKYDVNDGRTHDTIL